MRFTRKFSLAALGLMAACTVFSTARADDLGDARNLVSTLLEDARTTFSAKTLAPADRAPKLQAFLLRYGDMEMVAQEVLGRYWGKASAEQQTAFKGLLVDYIVGSYADRIVDFPEDEKITITGNEPAESGHILLHSLAVHGAESTPVDWIIAHGTAGRLVIADAAVEGVSPLQAMKSDFSAIIRANSGNIDALLGAMRQKIASYSAGKSGVN